jgi:succinyl-diaminopimelate desuccinylase
MKGQDAILVELFRSMHTAHPGISLGLALTSDEEIGGADGMRFLCEDVGLRCGFAIIPDGGSLRDVTKEEKGILHVAIGRKGKEAHAARPWLGENAVELLAESLVALKQHFAQYWPRAEIEEQANHWFPTCSITVFQTPNTTPNRIPSLAEAIIDIRFPPPKTFASMQEEIAAVLGPACEIRLLTAAEPTQLAPDPAFCRITAELTGEDVRFVRASGGSDSRFLRQYGIPVNLSRPLVGNLHAIDEWIDVDSMVTYYRICERYVTEKLIEHA